VTGTIIGKLRARSAAALAFVIASSSTGLADPRAAANIPTTEQKLAGPSTIGNEAATDELPLPYLAWQGTGPRPPTAPPDAKLPPPLARARQLPRRPIEASASLAGFLPSCGTGSVDDRGCLTVSPGSGLDLSLLYRLRPFFAVGAEGAVSGFAVRGDGALSGAGGSARFFGIVGRVYFADEGAWDPYLALTLGAGTLQLPTDDDDAHVSTTGFGGRVAGGVDYVFGTHLRLGPTASFAHWVAWSEQGCRNDICRDEPAAYGRLLGFATLGFRLTVSFGSVL
jgi:hypothetical protein